MAAFLLLATSPFGLPTASVHMDCGPVSVCGIMTLETGEGPDKYHHAKPSVHGIWPETGAYGTSKCIAPSVSSDAPRALSSCYDDLSFEKHEWGKHGVCAGVKDAADFFAQVCALSTAPLKVMTASVSGGGDVARAATDLKAAGYSVFATDPTNAQVELSACADASGTWHLAAVSDFGKTCGAGPSPGPAPGPAPAPSPAGQCVANQHGPPCKTDSDCATVEGCVRCAHSGYCSMEPQPAEARAASVVEA